MTATAEYIAGGSIGSHIPVATQATAAATAAATASLPGAQARLAGTISATATFADSPPSIAGILELANKVVLAAQAGISGPSVTVDIAAMGAATAELAAEVAALEAVAALAVEIGGLLGTSGVHLYLVEGEVGSHGTAIQSQLGAGAPGGSGPAQLGTGVYLVAVDNGAIAALRACFGL